MIVSDPRPVSKPFTYCVEIPHYNLTDDDGPRGFLTNGRAVAILQDELTIQDQMLKQIFKGISTFWRPYGDVVTCGEDPYDFCYTNPVNDCTALLSFDPFLPCKVDKDHDMDRHRRVPNILVCCPVTSVLNWMPLSASVAGSIKVCLVCGFGCGSVWASIGMIGGTLCVTASLTSCVTFAIEACAESIEKKRYKKKWQRTADKIQSFIAHLQRLPGTSPFPIVDFLTQLNVKTLSKITAYRLIKGMNLPQISEMRQRTGKDAFEQFENHCLSDSAKNALEILPSLKDNTRDIKNELLMLKSFMQHDRQLWETIVRSLPKEQWEKQDIRELLACSRVPQDGTEEQMKATMANIRMHLDTQVTLKVMVSGACTQKLSAPLALVIQYDYFNSLFTTSGCKETQSMSVQFEMSPLESEALPSLIEYMKTKRIDPDRVFGLLMLANRFQMGDCHAACYGYIAAMVRSHDISDAEFDIFLTHSPQQAQTNEEFVIFALNRAIEGASMAQIRKLLELAQKHDFKTVLGSFEANLGHRSQWKFETKWLSLVFYYNCPALQEAARSAILKDIKEDTKHLKYLQLCEGIPALLTDVRKKYAQVINPQNFQALSEYAERIKDRELRIALVQYRCKQLPVDKIEAVWTYAEQTKDAHVKQACLNCFQHNINSDNFQAFWNCAVTHKDHELKGVCKEYLKAHITDDRFRFIWEFAEQERYKDIKDALKEYLRKHQNKSELACQWKTEELPKDVLDLLK